MRTVPRLPVLLLLAASAPALAAPPATGAAPAHDHAAHAVPTAPGGSAVAPTFVADAALREAMGRVRAAVAGFDHARHGHMGPDQVVALADHLDAQIARVFRECRLEPRADASLHTVLATLARASRAVRTRPDDLGPVDAMTRALADYGRMFADPAPTPTPAH